MTYTDQLTVNGGKSPVHLLAGFRIAASGLDLSQATGAITGKPTTAGSYTFTIKVVDAKGFSDTATCTIVVKLPIDLNCGACGSTAGSGQTGSYYTDQLTVTGGVSPYTFSIVSGSLPPGLTLNTSTGKISGTPTTPGTYTFTAKVVDNHGNSDTATCTINIKGSLIDLECGACGTGGKATVGIQYTDALDGEERLRPVYLLDRLREPTSGYDAQYLDGQHLGQAHHGRDLYLHGQGGGL